MAHHKCNCMFVPPQVLENLAKAGVEEARLSIQQSKISRNKRVVKEIDMNAFWDGDEMTFGDGDGTKILKLSLGLRSELEGKPRYDDNLINDNAQNQFFGCLALAACLAE